MTRFHTLLPLAALAGALALAGCGGGDDSVPADAIAVVGDEEIERSEFDALINRTKKSFQLNDQKFPKAGTAEYNNIKYQAVEYLVQQAQFEQKAEDMDIEVTDAQVDKRLQELIKQFFGGNRKRYLAQIKRNGITEDQVRRDVRAQLIQQEIEKKVTGDVKVTDADIQKFYGQNKARYTTAESRDVRHILIAVCTNGTASSEGCMANAKAKALANDIHGRLQRGASFSALAKKYSDDPGSKDIGGKLTIVRGQTVAPFDQTAFLLGKGKLSSPVKTQYGYHIIEPLTATKPKKLTPLKDVKAQIRQELLQTKRREAMTKWVKDTKKDFEGETTYQVGFKPPSASAGTTTGDDS